MRPITFPGTTSVQSLIRGITQDFQVRSPKTNFVDYSLSEIGKNRGSIATCEDRGILHDKSRVSLGKWGKIHASVDNNSGSIKLEKVPFYMGFATAKARIMQFLERMQPENLAKITLEPKRIGENHPGIKHVEDTYQSKSSTVKRAIFGMDMAQLTDKPKKAKSLK